MVNKKGMGIDQVFIFIVAGITFALIMIFGYKAITDFVGAGSEVEILQFKENLESSVKKIYTEYGAVRIEDFDVSAGYEQVCFVDLNGNSMDGLEKKDIVAYDTWLEAKGREENSGKNAYELADTNVFLIPPAPVVIKLVDIKIDAVNENNEKMDYLCLDVVGGSFSLRLEGKGSYTLLSEVPRS